MTTSVNGKMDAEMETLLMYYKAERERYDRASGQLALLEAIAQMNHLAQRIADKLLEETDEA